MEKKITITAKSELGDLYKIGLSSEEIELVENTFPLGVALNGAYEVSINMKKVVSEGYSERVLEVIYLPNKEGAEALLLLRNSVKEAVKRVTNRLSTQEKVDRYLDFLEKNKRMPKSFNGKKSNELNQEERKERSISYSLQLIKRARDFTKIQKQDLDEAIKIVKELKEQHRIEKVQKIIFEIINFLEENKRLPKASYGIDASDLSETEKVERRLIMNFHVYKDSTKEPQSLLQNLKALWEKYSTANEGDGFSVDESIKFVIDFIEKNNRNPKPFNILDKSLSYLEIIEGRASQKFHAYKNSAKASKELLNKMNLLWANNSPMDAEWCSFSGDEKAREIIIFIQKNNRIPQSYINLSLKYLTEEQKRERSMVFFYGNKKSRANLSKAVSDELVLNWRVNSSCDYEWYKLSVDEKVGEIISFIEKNKRIPKGYCDKDIKILTNGQIREKSMASFFYRKEKKDISDSSLENLEKIWNKYKYRRNSGGGNKK